MSAMVGAFVGYLEQFNRWWMAGVSLLPLLLYGYAAASFEPRVIKLVLVYLLIALGISLMVSKLRQKKSGIL
jgi:hypothetical protein